MLGRREAQHSLFSAQGRPHRVPEDSFYGRLGAVYDELFRDEDLADICIASTMGARPGRPRC
jgi:hypothetical protein